MTATEKAVKKIHDKASEFDRWAEAEFQDLANKQKSSQSLETPQSKSPLSMWPTIAAISGALMGMAIGFLIWG